MSWWNVGALAVSAVGSYASSKKGEQKAAPVVGGDISLQQEQQNAIRGNLSSQDSIEALLSRANNFSADQALSLEDKTIPGYSKLRGKLAETSTSLLDNPYDLPKDVQDNLSRIAAERGVSVGTRGQFNDFSLLRDFGINSLQYGQQRIGQAQGIAGLLSQVSPKVNPMSPLAFYVAPSENAANTRGNNDAKQAGANAQTAATNANNSSWANLINGATGLFSGYLSSKAGSGTSGSVNGISPAGAH